MYANPLFPSKRALALASLLVFLSLFVWQTGAGQQQSSAAWSNPVDITGGISANIRSFDIMACDPYQNVHIFWADLSENGAAIFYRTNASGAWSFPTDIISVRDPSIYYLRTAISPASDVIHLTWTNLSFNGDVYYSNSALSDAKSPSSWLPPQVISSGVSNSDIAVDPQGNVHMVYAASDQTGINNEVYHIVSTNDGITWSEPEVVFSRTFSQPSFIQVWLDIDGRGRLHLGLTLRSQEYGVTSEVGYMRTLDDGKTWSEYQLVQSQGTTFQGVAWIEPFAFGDDEVHLTWHDPRRMHQYSMDGGLTWSSPEEIMSLGGAFGGPNELTKDSAGVIHVVTAVADGVYSVEWKDQQWGAPERIDTRYIDPHGQHILTCGGNQLHVAYYDRTGDESVWYSTRRVNAPAIEKRPIPKPTALPEPSPEATQPAIINQATAAAAEVVTIRETMAVEQQRAPRASVRPSLGQLLLGIIPSALIIAGIAAFLITKMRR